MNCLIFGGGISGLTIAHELLDKGFNVTIIEKSDSIGGMSKSRREINGTPSEHSWRGFAPFYKNTYEIMKRIPDNNKTVYDNLSLPIEFFLMKDEISNNKPGMNFLDKIIVYYYGTKYILADKRRKEYYKINLIPLLKNKLSKNGYDFLIEFMAGPGYGMEKKDISYGHFYKFPTLALLNKKKYAHSHNDKNGYYCHIDDFWHVTNKPTHEAWFEPWEKYLKKKGLKIYYNVELKKFNIKNNKIESCILNNGILMKADEYILCINPFDAELIFKRSEMNKLYNKHKNMNEKTESNQLSFRIGFNKKIKFNKKNMAFVMPDSEFNITWYPQDYHWDENVEIDKKKEIKSLWSGTIIAAYNKGKIYNKKATELNKNELINEILFQIFRSKSLQKMIKNNNGFYLTNNDINYIEIWYEWLDNKNTKYKKWINNIHNETFRPDQQTTYTNLFIGGSHTNTSIKIWSMEGAVESGKKVSNLICKKYNKDKVYLYNHSDPYIIKKIQNIDNILYKLRLPNILYVIIIIIIIILILIFKFVQNIIF